MKIILITLNYCSQIKQLLNQKQIKSTMLLNKKIHKDNLLKNLLNKVNRNNYNKNIKI